MKRDLPSNGAFDRLARIFERARAVSPGERESWLDRHCTGDAGMREEVRAMLEADDREGGLLDRAGLVHALVEEAGSGRQTRIGPYEIVRRLGGGGMATVYEAIQDAPNRTVALKLLRPGSDSPKAAQRLLFEAEILARLRHPAVAQVYEAGLHEVAGVLLPYLTLEFVPGARSILEYVFAARPSARERLELFLQVAEGVAHAHARGVLHRDLKPDNVLIDENGKVKIVDFGVARLLEPDVSNAERLTLSGQLVGTIQYMSPEQVSGPRDDVDARSDVYALGLLLYEVLLERRPYDVGPLPISDAVAAILDREPRIGSGELSADLRAIVGCALSKERERRYATVEALAADLRRHLAGHTVEARAPGTWEVLWRSARRNPRLFMAVAALVVTIVGAAGVSVRLLALADRENERASEARAQLQEAAMLLGDVVLAADPGDPNWRPEPLIGSLAAQLEADPSRDPAVQAVFRTVLARARGVGGDAQGAEDEFERAVELWDTAGSEHRVSLADALARLAQHRGTRGDAGGARRALLTALRVRAGALGDDHLRTHPDDLLRALIDAWLRDHPLATRDGFRADLDVAGLPDLGAFVPLDRSSSLKTIACDLGEIFGGADWSVSFENALGWEALASEGVLRVGGVTPGAAPGSWHRARAYRHPFTALGDFELGFQLSWDVSDPAGSSPRSHSLHLVLVELHTRSNGMLARGGISDSQLYHSGSVIFDHGGDAIVDRGLDFGTGPGSLPYAGSARVGIVRRGEIVRYAWNGRVLFEARDARPIAALWIHVASHLITSQHNHFESSADRPTSVRAHVSHFGHFEIADLELRGVSAGLRAR